MKNLIQLSCLYESQEELKELFRVLKKIEKQIPEKSWIGCIPLEEEQNGKK